MADELKVPENKVHATLEEDGTVTFQGDSDALISKGSSLEMKHCSSSPVHNRPSTTGFHMGARFKLMNKKVAMLKAGGKVEEANNHTETTKTPKTTQDSGPELQIYNTLAAQKGKERRRKEKKARDKKGIQKGIERIRKEELRKEE
eukprot:Skav215226  [mRNA]  locus=scaffold341:257522:258759:+ [translate_table: standard]